MNMAFALVSKVTYTRDALGWVISVSAQINAAATPVTVASGITHAPFGPLTGLTFGNGVVLTQTYDLDYRLSTLAATGVQNLTYSHDAAGNISAISDSITPARSQTFVYDDLNRLTAAIGAYGAYGYAYDLSGNRIAQSRGAANDNYTIALSSNRLTQISGGATRSITYDAAGNTANDNRGPGADYAYTHDSAGDMAQLERDGLTLARYTSDARHLRAIRDLPGAAIPKTHFLYDTDGNLLAEHDGVSGAVLREMIWLPPTPEGFGGRGPAMDAGAALPVGWINAEAASPAMYFVHADHLGTPQKLTDAAGAIAWDGVFAPFGETHAATGTLAQNLRFPGQFADSESGLSYNWHRTYDPALGRYLQSDPIGLAGGINSYAYVNGNPLRYTDPQGLNPAVGATIGGTVAGPVGATVGALLGLGAMAILNEILDGAEKPAEDIAEFCRKERRACAETCEKAECDPDMKNVWGGSIEKCIRGCLPAACGGNRP